MTSLREIRELLEISNEISPVSPSDNWRGKLNKIKIIKIKSF
jgi:hypothetical protein